MSQKTLKFHIKSDDYFGTLATVLSLVNQLLKTKDKNIIKIFTTLEKDLLYLQKEYKIVKK
jgi:hypothetical protein